MWRRRRRGEGGKDEFENEIFVCVFLFQWRTVRMKNSQVSDWKGFTDSLSRHGTKHLDLRKMLMSLDDAQEMWGLFAKHISGVKCLERLDMCRCSVNIVVQVMEACPQLFVFNAQQMIGSK